MSDSPIPCNIYRKSSETLATNSNFRFDTMASSDPNFDTIWPVAFSPLVLGIGTFCLQETKQARYSSPSWRAMLIILGRSISWLAHFLFKRRRKLRGTATKSSITENLGLMLFNYLHWRLMQQLPSKHKIDDLFL